MFRFGGNQNKPATKIYDYFFFTRIEIDFLVVGGTTCRCSLVSINEDFFVS
jgi:hypothetical protein